MMTKQELVKILEAAPYTFAKSMPKTPHCYTLRERFKDDDKFDATVMAIRQYGKPEAFFRKTFTYFYANGYKYWTMGCPLNDTWVLNRAEVDYRIWYDDLAETYDQVWTDDFYKAEDHEVIKMIGYTGGSILDAGCGTGLLLDYLTPDDYTGVDMSDKMLQVLLKKHRFKTISLVNTSFDDFYVYEMYDYAVALFGAGSYIPPYKMDEILRQSKRAMFMLYREGILPHTYEINHKEPAYNTLKDYAAVVEAHNLTVEEYHNYVILRKGV